MRFISVEEAAELLRAGEVIAYPTEAVYGLGCDPHNVQALTHLLTLKQRSPNKGVILIASSVEQIQPYIDLSALPEGRWESICAHWPGPFTWVFPASNQVPPLVKGHYPTVAVRVTAHPVAQALCAAFNGPLVSTSANVAEQPAIKDPEEISLQFPSLEGIVLGALGNSKAPTTIRDAMNEKLYRLGDSAHDKSSTHS